MKNKRIFVTGANGFIGRFVCSALIRSKFMVRGALREARKPEIQEAGLEWFSIGDIGLATDWNRALEGVSIVVHLAARVHVMKETASDPLTEFQKINVLGTERLARMASKAGVRRFIFVSSIGVNGNRTSSQIPCFSESVPPMPYDPYSISKWEAEQALIQVSKETGLEVVTLRPPLVYGPNAPGNFDRLMSLILNRVPLPLASVHNRRSFIYVKNLADAIVRCVQQESAGGETFLVSDGENVSTPGLIRRISSALGRPEISLPCPTIFLSLIGKLTGKSATVNRLINSLAIDSSKIHRQLRWTPPYSMEQGLAETASWYLKSLKK